MDELFFHWRKRLNIKKVVITIFIIMTLILLILFFYIIKEKPIGNTSQTSIYHPDKDTTTFLDKNRFISLELSNNYDLKQYTSTKDYLLELRSKSNLAIFVSFKNKIEGKNFKDVVSADKFAFIENFSTVSNTSEIEEFTTNQNVGYTYGFHYLDKNLNTTFYIQVIWLEIDNNYYIFDIEFPLNDLNHYINVVTDVLSNFQKI